MLKKIITPIVALLFVACSSEPGKTKEIAKPSPLVCENSKVESIDLMLGDTKLSNNKVPFGSTFTVIFKKTSGFKAEKGKVFLDASIQVFDSLNNKLVNLDKLFDEEYKDGMPVEIFSENLLLSLICRTPLKMNNNYKVVFTIKDKLSTAKVTYSDNFSMVPTPGLTYKEEGLKSDGFFFCINNLKYGNFRNEINPGDVIHSYCTGLNGFSAVDGKVWIDANISLFNDKNILVNEFKDLFKDYDATGVNESDVKDLLSLDLSTSEKMKSGEKYYAIFSIGDKKAKTKVTGRYDFVTK